MSSGSPIEVAYSPDADDAFMFWAIAHDRIDLDGFRFRLRTADTETLNRGAEATPTDVTAISIHQYAYLHDAYQLLPHGGSVGVGYGPVLVAERALEPEILGRARIGVPGLRTTGYLVLRLLLGDFQPVVVPVSPFARAYEALARGEVDAALLIHEGRLLYERQGLHRILDLGEAWHAHTGLPLPLGGNVIRRALGAETIARVSAVLRRSIAWALEHREQVLDDLVASETRDGVPRERALFDRYLAMYANRDTLDYGPEGRRAVAELLRRGHEAGVIPRSVQPDFAP